MSLDLSKIDLGTLKPLEDEIDPVQPVRASLSEAVKVNPDAAAKTRQLAQQSGLPDFAVQDDPAGVEARLKLDAIDFTEMSKRSPGTAGFFTDFNNAAIAHDDIDVMQKIEDAVGAVRQYGADLSASFEKGRRVVEASDIGLQRMYAALGSGEPVSDDQVSRLADLEKTLQKEVGDYGFLTGAPVVAAEQLPIMWEILQTGAGGAVVGGAGGAAVGAVTGPGALATGLLGAKWGGRIGVAKGAFDLEAGLAFNEFAGLTDDEGNVVSPEVAGYGAAAVGGMNAALEAVSFAALGRTVTPAMRYMLRNRVKQAMLSETGRDAIRRIGGAYAAAVATESITEGLQELSNVIGAEFVKLADRDAFTEQDLGDVLDNIFSAETAERVGEATLVGAQASLVLATPGTVVSAVTEQRRLSRLAEDEQARIDELNVTSQESKLKERDIETFKQFVSKADGENNTTVFIDGAQAKLYLNSKSAEEIEADPALRILSEQVNEAATLGGDVQVTVADFAGHFTGTEHFDALREHMTLSAETVSPFRQEQATREQETYIQNLMRAAQENESSYVESQEVFATVREQLVDTGRYTPEQASALSQVVPAYMTVYAQENGISVAEAYQRTGLVIEGPQTGRAEALRREGAEVFEQSTPEQAAKFAARLAEAKAARPVGAAVGQYDVESYEGMDTYLLDDGRAGFAVTPDGTLVSVFKHPDSTIGKAMDMIVPMAIRAGATKLDAFEGFLTEQYARFGFEEVDRLKWDDQYAPEGWDKETMGTPDVVLMELKDDSRRTGGEAGVQPAPTQADQGRESDGSLRGLPRIREASVSPEAAEVARKYMEDRGLTYEPPTNYVKVDRERAARIASAYDEMQHSPEDPEVLAAYNAMIEETIAQYQAILDSGLVVEFIDFEKTGDPYEESPRLMTEDVRANNHMWVFSTREGFGSDDTFDPVDNPLLRDTEFTDANGAPMLVNDVFRVVHDYFGHVKEGVGFRADGEENAWRAHAAMYSPLARRAMTSETRGQNSWVNFGPYGEQNRTASAADTHYADQKIGLLPEWVSEEGRTDVDPNAGWTDERIRSVIQEYQHAAGGKSKARIGFVNPMAFVEATTGDTQGIIDEAGDLDLERLQGQPQTPFIRVEDGKIVGHEGRHRMAALSKAGVTRAPVVVVDVTGYSDERRPGMKISAELEGQDVQTRDGEDAVGKPLQLEDSILAVSSNIPAIKEAMGQDPGVLYQGATEGAPIRQAQRNDLGLYSAVEQAVIDLNIQNWKKDLLAPGKDVWNKLRKSPGVKAEELEWLGMESFLNSGDKFSREDVLQYVRKNGIVLEETQTSGDGAVDAELQEVSREIDDDESNWEYRVDEAMYGFDNLDDSDDFIAGIEIDEFLEQYFDNNPSDFVSDVYHTLSDEDKKAVDAIPSHEESVEWILENTDLTLRSASNVARAAFEERAETEARLEYMDDPVYITTYEIGEGEYIVSGNDDRGYFITEAGRHVDDDIYSTSEAEIRIQEDASAWGYTRDEGDETAPRWEEYVTEGSYENYRELKLKLPNMDTFTYDAHFGEEENIVAFLRVSDRNLISAPETASKTAEENARIDREAEERRVAAEERVPDLPVSAFEDMTEIPDNLHINSYGEFWPEVSKKDAVDATAVGERWANFTAEKRHEMYQAGRKAYIRRQSRREDYVRPEKSLAYFIEEFQSDWHQQGRQVGYQTGMVDPGELDLQGADLLADAKEKADALAGLRGDKLGELDEQNPELRRAITSLFELTGEDALDRAISEIIVGKKIVAEDRSEGFDLIKAHPELLSIGEDIDSARKLAKEAEAERYGVPDAPFKGNGWIQLGLRRAIVDAVEQGYESLAWADSNVLSERWSERYRTLYETQYDTKMRSMIKKMTGQEPQHFDMSGDPHEHQSLGYWVVPLTDEFRAKVEEEGFPLFQRTDSQEARGYYDPANSLIRLTESADLSTFLHEFAHFIYETEMNAGSGRIAKVNQWFKRNGEEVVKEAATYLKEGTPTVEHLNAFLDNGTTGDAALDSALRRATHEQFARGFEAYLMEGKAPSVELRNAFRRFARWLVEVYRSVRGDLKVNLDNEMREVFDRLLATEEQIAAAQARSQFEPMFTDAAMAGMTEEEFAKYKEQQNKATDKAAETLRDKLIKQLTRQTQQWWRAEMQDIIDEQLRVRADDRVERARASLRGDTLKLDHATVKALMGEKRKDKRGRESVVIPTELRGMTAKGGNGVSPDDAAAFFGYSSGSEMLEDLVTAPPAKQLAETEAQRIMVERHGDILNDGTIEREANEAVQNEAKGELILRELKALNKGLNRPGIERSTIKDIAERRIGQLSFREIHPEKYRRAEIRAAQEAARALAAGNKEEAATAKARQVMNYYLGMAATSAKNDTVKIVDRMSRYSKKSVREEIAKAGNDYLGQLDRILSRFELRKTASLRQVDEVNQSLQAWADERIREDGDALVLTAAVLNESYVTHWKNVPYSDLVGVRDSVKNIEHVARYANRITRQQEEIDFQKLVQRWVDHMNAAQESRFKSQRTTVAEGRNWGRMAMAQMTKIPFLASWLDGGERAGMSHDILVRPFNDAYAEELKLWDDVAASVLDAIQGRSKEDMKRHNRKIFIRELKDDNNDGNLYGHQVLAVALNTGNAGNLRKMLLGEGWANPENDAEISLDNPKLQAVLRHMTKSDWEMVQLIWDQMEELYPSLAEVHRRTTGLTPPKVEATPVETQFGTFSGGYYPVKYDPNRSFRAEQREDRLNAETESMFGTVGIQASVNASATNERTGYFAPIRLSLDVVPAHFQETIHYITHHDAVRETNKLIKNAEVARVIKAKLGPEEYAQLRPWLNDIAKDGREAPMKTWWGSILQRLRFGTTLGVMGFKASTGIIQVSGLSNTVAEVGLSNVIQAARNILGSRDNMKDAWDFATANSKILANRSKTMDREIKNAMERIQGKRGILVAVQEASMKHIALIQTYTVDLPSWYAAYYKGLDQWGDEQRAYQYADWVVENVQGSGATKDMAQILRNQSQEARMFTMFMTFFSSLWNLERDLVKGGKSGLYSTTDLAAKGMFLFTGPVLFEMLMRGELGEPDDGDDERLQKFLVNSALFPVQSVPFLRDIASGVIGDYGYNISPLAQLIDTGVRTIPEVVTRGFTDEEITKSQAKGATRFIGAAAGVPGVSQAWATGEHMYDVIVEGEELTMHQLLFGPKRD